MKNQTGDAGVSFMVVMMVVAVGFWMFAGKHGGHGMMHTVASETKVVTENRSLPQLPAVSAGLVANNEVVQD